MTFCRHFGVCHRSTRCRAGTPLNGNGEEECGEGVAAVFKSLASQSDLYL